MLLMKYTALLLAVFLSIFSLFAEEELFVQVGTESALSPLYLDSIQDCNSGFDKAYLQQLEKILKFDLQHNGATFVVQKNVEHENQVKKEQSWKSFDGPGWEALHLHYVVKAKIEDKKLSTSAFIVSKNAIKGMEGISLSGVLSEDRQKIHQVADTIYQTLFNKKGIASCRVLFTVRQRGGENSAQWQTDVWESDYDGANAKQVTHDNFLCVTPSYLPFKTGGHCKQFLYVSYKIGQPKIFAASVEDGVGKRVTLLRGNQLMPVLSPRRDLMAFVSDISGNPELYVQSFSTEKGLTGKPVQVFSAPNGAQASPTFSPDGKKIAFVSNKDGAPRIYVIAVSQSGKDSKPQLITKQNKDNTCPAWSPDGSKIAYSALTKGVRQIWVYDFTTGKETQLTDGAGHKENPAWAPNSLHLLFNSSNANSSELYLINLNQKEAVKIGQLQGEKRFPAWEPC